MFRPIALSPARGSHRRSGLSLCPNILGGPGADSPRRSPPGPASADRGRLHIRIDEGDILREVVGEHLHQLLRLLIVGRRIGPGRARIEQLRIYPMRPPRPRTGTTGVADSPIGDRHLEKSRSEPASRSSPHEARDVRLSSPPRTVPRPAGQPCSDRSRSHPLGALIAAAVFHSAQISSGVRGQTAPGGRRRDRPQPIAAAFTSASMKGTYCAKLLANISTSFFAC